MYTKDRVETTNKVCLHSELLWIARCFISKKAKQEWEFICFNDFCSICVCVSCVCLACVCLCVCEYQNNLIVVFCFFLFRVVTFDWDSRIFPFCRSYAWITLQKLVQHTLSISAYIALGKGHIFHNCKLLGFPLVFVSILKRFVYA